MEIEIQRRSACIRWKFSEAVAITGVFRHWGIFALWDTQYRRNSSSLPSNDCEYYTTKNKLKRNKFGSCVRKCLHWYSFSGGLLHRTTRVTSSRGLCTACFFMLFIVIRLAYHVTIPVPTQIRSKKRNNNKIVEYRAFIHPLHFFSAALGDKQ